MQWRYNNDTARYSSNLQLKSFMLNLTNRVQYVPAQEEREARGDITFHLYWRQGSLKYLFSSNIKTDIRHLGPLISIYSSACIVLCWLQCRDYKLYFYISEILEIHSNSLIFLDLSFRYVVNCFLFQIPYLDHFAIVWILWSLNITPAFGKSSSKIEINEK